MKEIMHYMLHLDHIKIQDMPLVLVVEHGGSGSSTAAPIAKKLFKLIIDRHELREKIRNKIIKI